MIPFLIDKQDTVEIVRDQIGAILASEAASQQALAIAAGKDESEWTFRTFIERSNPWADFLDATAPQPPVINVTLENCAYLMGGSTIVGEFTGTSAMFNIDCYGHGMSADEVGPGHTVGDEMGSLEAQRAARFVRNIFSAANYTYLGMRKTVHRRWVESLTIMQPSLEGRELQQVVAARMALRVEFNEFAPQYVGEVIELISATIKRKETGEIYFVGDYPQV
jgi:hypothetical protein